MRVVLSLILLSQVYSYNDDYPTTFEIDPHNVTCSRGYRIGDLMNTLPDGMRLHPKHEKQLTTNIFTMKANTFKMMMEEVRFKSNVKKEETGISLEELHLVNQPDEVGDKDKTKEEIKKEQEAGKKPKTMFDYVVDKRESLVKEKEIAQTEMIQERTYAEQQREEKRAKKAEIKKKMGLKTPFGNVKKAILEEYSLKENFKDRKESKDKKGGGGGGDKGGEAPAGGKDK